ncbi:MAG: hypothetical protein JW720_07275 [Sedimentisphaerales bacterium]|nr:hypothetical protein [Sedimentisphaerales bacterium]
MKKTGLVAVVFGVAVLCGVLFLYADKSVGNAVGTVTEDDDHDHDHDTEAWNRGEAPEDWWAAIERMHGHVGPWNVLGWRIGQAALHEFDSKWGRHELEFVCYVPMQTPYTCLADGLVMGTGNCLGRLDVRLAEVFSMNQIVVAVRRKDQTGSILVFEPRAEYLERIKKPKSDELEKLSRQCIEMKEADLFGMERVR